MAWHSQTWTYFNGDWHEGNPPIMGPRAHAFWLGSSVFDGARRFEGVMPDLQAHAERVNRSAEKLGLTPTMTPDAIVGLVEDGAKKFAPDAALYIRPMYWGEQDHPAHTLVPDPDTAGFCLSLWEAPMPPPSGFRVCVSPFRRPSLETMPTDVKTGSLYPNNARAVRDAKARGFDNALVLDMLGNVAEYANSNAFMAKDGVVFTPQANSTFLNGITRQRVIRLLREAGVEVREATLSVKDFLEADEVFSSGNYGKVQPAIGVEDRPLQPGPMFRKARELYWAFAHDSI